MTAWIISSSVLILVVTALRFLLKGKIPLRLQYALWGLVLLRLLAPFSIGESSFSVQNAVSAKQTQAYLTRDVLPVPDIGGQQNEPSAGAVIPASDTETSTDHVPADAARIRLDRILQGVWAAGTAVAAVIFLCSNLRFAVCLRRSRQRVEQEQTTLPVYVSNAVETPCLFGLFRPAIYITPEVFANQIALRHVLAHETTHYRHGDSVWALLRCVCLAVHWYNPLVWLAAVLSRRDGELACDEGTIRRIGEGERLEYGRTLIGLTCVRHGGLGTTATTMVGGKRSIRERITLIAKKPRNVAAALVIAIVISLLAMGCTFTGAETAPDTSDTPDISDADLGSQSAEAVVVVSVAPEVDPSSPALGSAKEYMVQKILEYHDQWAEAAPENRITEGRITAITPVASAIAAENVRLDLYRLEYRLLLDGEVDQELGSGMTYEEMDGAVWLTEWDSAGQPYLLESSELQEGRIAWGSVCATTTAEIDSIYSAYLEQAADSALDKYTVAARELYQFYMDSETEEEAPPDASPYLQGTPLTEEEIAQVNAAFDPIVPIGEGIVTGNPLNCFFTSYYEQPESIDLVNFLSYCPLSESVTDQTEFEALKAAWNLDAETLDEMPAPIHKYPAATISAFLEQYAGISVTALTGWEDSSELLYLEEYEAFYNIHGDFAAGTFDCVRGEDRGDTVVLYSNQSVLTLRKSGENYLIQSFLPI